MRPMWSKFSYGRNNFLNLILTQTPSLTWSGYWSTCYNKFAYKPSVKDIMDKNYEMFRDKNSANKKDFFNSPDSTDHSDQDTDTDG